MNTDFFSEVASFIDEWQQYFRSADPIVTISVNVIHFDVQTKQCNVKKPKNERFRGGSNPRLSG